MSLEVSLEVSLAGQWSPACSIHAPVFLAMPLPALCRGEDQECSVPRPLNSRLLQHTFALPSFVPPALCVLPCFGDSVTGCDEGVTLLLVLAEPAVNRQRAASSRANGTILGSRAGLAGAAPDGTWRTKKGIKQQTWKLERE